MNNLIEFKEFFKKNIYIWLITLIAIEAGFLFMFKDFPKTKVTVVSAGTIFAASIFVMLMLSSLENAFYSLGFAYVLLPYTAYLFYILEISNQWIAHLILFTVFFISFIKNGGINKLNFKNKLKDVNKIYFIMVGLILLSSITAFDKMNSFAISIFGIILPIVYFIFVYNLEISKDRKIFIEKIFFCVAAGIVLSGAADLGAFVLNSYRGARIKHFTGPLGSNFIIAYSLIIYPFLIINYKRFNDIKFKKAYLILIILETIIFATQMSRGLIIALVFLFPVLLLSKKNLKYYTVLLLLVIVPVSYNASARNDVKRDVEKISVGDGFQKEDIEVFIEGQSMNRTVIWIPAINMIKDYPVLGVGMGNFKHFFLDYATTLKKPYIDAHNFILTSATELGIIFTIIFIGYLLVIFIRSLKRMHKLKDDKYLNMGLLAFLGAGFAYFSFANTTGAAFQCAGKIQSYTPAFMIVFIIFYYEYLMTYKKGNSKPL